MTNLNKQLKEEINRIIGHDDVDCSDGCCYCDLPEKINQLLTLFDQKLKEREKETLNKLRRWLKGRKICIHDKDLVRNWINSQQLKP